MTNQWGAGNAYAVDDVVVYQGYYYKVIQAHTSQDDWAPDKTPALWGRQGQCNEFFTTQDDAKVFEKQHDDVVNAPHKANITHEVLAGGAAFAAAKAWEIHQAKNGKPVAHGNLVGLLAGAAGVFIDNIVETKGLDYIDKAKAKKQAQEMAEEHAESNYAQSKN